MIKQFCLINLCLSSTVAPVGLRVPFSTVADLPGVQGRKRGKGEASAPPLLKREKYGFLSSHRQVPGLSEDGASGQADLKCSQTDIMLQRVSPSGPEAELSVGRGQRAGIQAAFPHHTPVGPGGFV